ncbi:PAC2 family protein [Nesterenkonia sp.]|uniref:PAC2 family protein n=1 Tax=Nesterenkonia sp. TaxID=704201 RepID=UPI002604C0BA|nr:PAC2 family protein [Nesterenkonia sp.]
MTDPFDLLHIYAEGSQHADSGAPATGAELVLHGEDSPGGPQMPMVVSIAGHTDAGSLSEQLAESLLGRLPNKRLASFDVDELFDYRSRRPHLTFTDNRFTDYQGPQLNLFEVRDAMDRPFLLLTGDEPDFQWERVTDTVLRLVEQMDVSLVVLVDALGLPTPHTRPIGVTAHGNRKDLIEGISTWSPNAQIEAGLSQMLELRADAAGRDVVGYTLHVPHYLAAGKYPQVAVAALEYTGAACELMLPTDELREAARMVDADISRQVGQSPEVTQLVKQLEANFDQYATPAQRSLLVRDDNDLPDAEELGAAVEEYLRSQPEDVIFGVAEEQEQEPTGGGAEDSGADQTSPEDEDDRPEAEGR